MKSAITSFVRLSAFRKTGKTHEKNCELDSGKHIQSSRCLPAAPSETELSSHVILENLPSHISSLDVDGKWKNIARGNCKYFHSIKTDDFAQWVSEVVNVQDRVAVLKAVGDCRSGSCNTVAEFRLLNSVRYADAPKWVELSCTAIAAENTILTALADISERKLLETSTLRAREISDAANLEKSIFLASMSHELRTPLNTIIGFSEILKSGMVPASHVEKQMEYHGLINDSAQHLLNVLNDILDMSKIEAGKYEIFPENIELSQINSSCFSMLRPLADKAGVRLRITEFEEPLQLEADSKAVRQILINLISNAIKFTRNDTDIVVSAKRIGCKIEWKIRDQGQGISAENLERLGEPFHQIDGKKTRQREGSGLGLSIVKGLINLHKGSFDIDSKLGVGTTVTVQLPMSLGLGSPVPAQEVDTIIRIKPLPSETMQQKSAISRLVG